MTGQDQAHNLRDAVMKKGNLDRNPRVICVSSGKGGVGKSNFTLNLALAIQKRGKNVVVIDADIGLANIEILLGIMPENSLLDVIRSDLNIEDIITPLPGNVGVISGGSGLNEVTELSADDLNKLFDEILRLRNVADYILIDTGAGISKSVTSFIEATNELIVITTPEPPAIADAYALIKTLSPKKDDRKFGVVVNKVWNVGEGEAVFAKISMTAKKFLDKELEYLGCIHLDDNVSKAVRNQKPFYIAYPKTKAAMNLNVITAKIMQVEIEKSRGFGSFMERLKGVFSIGGKNGK